MSQSTVKPIDEMHTINAGLTKLAGAELGVESFGMQVFDFAPGFPDYPEHDHTHDGQEEIYVVLRGSGDIELDGERFVIDRDRLTRVVAGTKRKLLPGSEGLRVLVLGATPGELYERPNSFRLPSS